MDWSHIIALLIIAFACNLLLGKWRSYQRRLSFRWFAGIHLSIPVIVFLRVLWQLPLWMVFFSIGTAVVAQIIGGAMQPEWVPLFKRRASNGEL
ncbi:MAG: hypothetical protein Q7O66_23030 [Dehalococcoidia bacterium]|nr:hypothetical protein [Dehalococcoidia bacterium]